MNRKSVSNEPVIKFRFILKAAVVVTVLISLPLLIVWKEQYITSRSIEIEQFSDSLVKISREITNLKLTYEHLSSNSYIERIARKSLKLDYPVPEQIVIIKLPPETDSLNAGGWRKELAIFIKRSILRNRG